MGKVAHRDGGLFLNVGVEGALVVDLEVEDAVLVGQLERGRVGGAVGARGDGLEGQAVEGRQHAELELQGVLFGDGEGGPGVPDVLGQRDGVGDVVLDAVDLGVALVALALLVEVVLDPVDAQDARLAKGPARHALGKVAVERGHGRLGAVLLDLGVEPLVAQHVGAADDGDAGRVAGLEGGDERELAAGGEEVVDNLGLLLGVVAVGGAGGAQDGCEQRAGAQGLSNARGEGEKLAIGGGGGEEILHIGTEGTRGSKENNIVLLGSGRDVIVEVVDDETAPVRRQVDVELEQGRDDRGRGRVLGGEGDEDVALGVDELDENVGGQAGAEALDLCRQEDEVVILALAESE